MKDKKVMKYIIIVAVILIPIMYSFFYLKAYWDPYGNLQDMKIAMVNLDNGDNGENQGQKLVNSMIENGTFNVIDAKEEEANEGLKNGKYYAVITIPSEFTQDLNSAQDVNKQITTITYSPNQKSNYLASQIINSAIRKIELNLQSQVAEKVTESLTEKLNDVPESIQEIADGAEQIEDGAKALNDGANKLSDGTSQLNNSYEKFDEGIDSAYEGSSKLDGGISSLQEGANSLENGANSLYAGVNTLSDGITTLNDGTNVLNAGATEVNAGAQKLKMGTTDLSDGASKVSVGATSVSEGANKLEGYLSNLYEGIQKTKVGYVSIDDGINEAVSSIEKIKEAMEKISSESSDLQKLQESNEKAITTLQTSNKSIETNYNSYFATSLGNKALNKVTDEDIKKVATSIATQYAPVLGTEKSGQISKTYAALLTTWRDTYLGNAQLIELSKGNLKAVKTVLGLLSSEDLKILTSDETKNKLQTLKAGSKTMEQTLSSLEDNIEKIYNGSKDLSAGAIQVSNGANEVSTGANTVAIGVNSLADGTNKLENGTKSLVEGTNNLKNGSNSLRNGTKNLKDGTEALTQGIGTLKQGSTDLNSGLEILAKSSKEVKQGVSQIDDGVVTLSKGTNTLVNGSKRFTGEINSGLANTKHELVKLDGLSKFVASPAQIKEDDYGKVEQYGLSFTPLFLSIGLWVGALMAYVVFYYDQDKRFKLLGKYADNKFLQILLYFLIAVAQGIITGLLLKVGLGFAVTNVALYYFSCICISVVFMSIIQFLIMNFEDVGKFIALVILVLQLAASGGTFPVETVAKGFQSINGILPMTYSIKLVKEAVIMQDAGFALKNIIVLLVYLIATLAITLGVQFVKKRKIKEDVKQN